MAAAVVSGAAADLFQANPGLTRDQAKALLMQTACKLSGVKHRNRPHYRPELYRLLRHLYRRRCLCPSRRGPRRHQQHPERRCAFRPSPITTARREASASPSIRIRFGALRQPPQRYGPTTRSGARRFSRVIRQSGIATPSGVPIAFGALTRCGAPTPCGVLTAGAAAAGPLLCEQ